MSNNMISALRSGRAELEAEWFWFRDAPSNRRRASMRPRIVLFGEGEEFLTWRREAGLREMGAAARKQVIPAIKAFCQVSQSFQFHPNDKFAASGWVGTVAQDAMWVPRDPDKEPAESQRHKVWADDAIPFIVKYFNPKQERPHATMPYFMLFGKVKIVRK
jgi:hypothetical protein